MQKWKAERGTYIGPYHTQNNLPNQDAVGFTETNDVFAMAVADGAGSLKNSDIGSKIAVDAVLNEALTTHEVSAQAMTHLLDVGGIAVLNENDPEMGCTLAVVLATPEKWVAGTIGDSFVIVKDAKIGYSHTSSQPNEYANITQLVTSEDPHYNIREGEYPIGLAVSSDGLENTSLIQGRPHEAFWDNLFKRTESELGLGVAALFEHMDRLEKISDDTTLAIAVLNKDSES